MTLTNKYVNKIAFFITFLLLHLTVTSCDSCKSEKDKLQQEERLLIEKIKKQLNPDGVKEFVEQVQLHRSNKEEINKAIKGINPMLTQLEEAEKNSEQARAFLLIPPIQQGLDKVKGGNSTDSKQQLALMKQFYTDCLALYQNFQKQAELK